LFGHTLAAFGVIVVDADEQGIRALFEAVGIAEGMHVGEAENTDP
jgi:hypothetical protein